MMESFNEDKFNSILSVVKRSRTDNEKFAALLIILKQTKAETLPRDKLQELLKTIGIQFPIRLLSTASTNTDENSVLYATIGASILGLFCSEKDLCRDTSRAVAIIGDTMKFFSRKDDESTYYIIKDCFACITGMLGNNTLPETDGTKVLFDVLCQLENQYNHEQLICSMLQRFPYFLKSSSFADYIRVLAYQFKSEEGNKKFVICEKLSSVLRCILPMEHCDALQDCVSDIMCSLKNVMYSKLSPGKRRMGLGLTSELLRIFGLSTFMVNSKEEKFLVIITRLACIEVGLFLRDVLEGNSDVLEDEKMLTSVANCLMICETFCSGIFEFEQNESELGDVLNFELVRLTQPSLADLAKSLEQFISPRLAEHGNLSPIEILCLKMSIKLLASWLVIKNHITSAQGIETASLVPKMLQYIIETEDLDLLKPLIPTMTLTCESSSVANALLESGLLPALRESLNMMSAKHREKPSSTKFQEMCGLIKNAALELCFSLYLCCESEEVSKHFEEICQLYLELEDVSCKSSLVPVVGLIYTSIHLDAFDSKYKAVCIRSLDLLFEAYRVSPESGSLVLNDRYVEKWADVSSVWEECISRIAIAISENSFVKKLWAETKWPQLLPTYIEAAKDSTNDRVKELFSNLSIK